MRQIARAADAGLWIVTICLLSLHWLDAWLAPTLHEYPPGYLLVLYMAVVVSVGKLKESLSRR